MHNHIQIFRQNISCMLLISGIAIAHPPLYIDIPEVVYFTAKEDQSLIGSGQIERASNELFFYGFRAPNATLAEHLKEKISSELLVMSKKGTHSYAKELSAIMTRTLCSFYHDYMQADPCNTESQKIIISFLHLIDNKVCVYDMQCIDGTFKLTHEASYQQLDPLHNIVRFIPILQEHRPIRLTSSVYQCIKTNEIARRVMYQRPQELIERIIEKEPDNNVLGLISLYEKKWLQQIQCHAVDPIYKNLLKKWLAIQCGQEVTKITDIERSILAHAQDTREQLLQFTAQRYQQADVPAPVLSFLNDMIEQSTPKKPSCLTARILKVFNAD